MSHITDEQFEDILQGKDADHAHLRQCKDCRDRLAEKRAIAERLRSAFGSVRAGSDLADRISQKLGTATGAVASDRPAKRVLLDRHRRPLWPALAAAAVTMIVLVPLSMYFGTSSTAKAAQAELVGIHKENLGPDRVFFSDAEPEKLAEYFKSELGFGPAFPCTGQGMAIRGCCVAHFRDRIVGSYVVDTPEGVISIIVVTDTPKSLGMRRMSERTRSGQTCWKASFARCRMVTVRLGDYSYCAVGEISHKYLLELISRLLS
ncbi:MAG: anti-sigma factor family protein [Planctomycetota bacterium]|jgi:hypothetical protein